MTARPVAVPTLTDKWRRLPFEFAVRFSIGPGGMACEWSPDTPSRWPPELAEAYRMRRDRFMQKVATRIGGGVMVLEL